MKISKAEAEEGLIKLGRINREQAKKYGAERKATIFKDEVKRDYSVFFPAEPGNIRRETAVKLFQSEGPRTFPKKKPSTTGNEEKTPRMSLSLADAEKKLIKRGAFTKAKVQEMDKSSRTLYGRDKRWMKKSFLEEVKKDYSVFFPSEPSAFCFKKNATKLFQYGGTVEFLIKPQPTPAEIKSEDQEEMEN